MLGSRLYNRHVVILMIFGLFSWTRKSTSLFIIWKSQVHDKPLLKNTKTCLRSQQQQRHVSSSAIHLENAKRETISSSSFYRELMTMKASSSPFSSNTHNAGHDSPQITNDSRLETCSQEAENGNETDIIVYDDSTSSDSSSVDKGLRVYHLQRCVTSTQDEAKQILLRQHQRKHFAVIADNQSNGRGTSGRSWIASSGNLFLTYCLPMNDILIQKLTLLPIGVGALVAEALTKYVSVSNTKVTVKWPNDILINQQKVAGILIENTPGPPTTTSTNEYWLLIGIGVNLVSHPSSLPAETKAAVSARPATCLKDHINNNATNVPLAINFGVDLSREINRLIIEGELGNKYSQSTIIQRWRSFAQFGENYVIRETGEKVKTISIENDGQLRVIGEDDNERILVSDYFV